MDSLSGTLRSLLHVAALPACDLSGVLPASTKRKAPPVKAGAFVLIHNRTNSTILRRSNNAR